MIKKMMAGLLMVAVCVVGLGCGKKAVDEKAQMDSLKDRAAAGRPLSNKERELLEEEMQQGGQAAPAQQ